MPSQTTFPDDTDEIPAVTDRPAPQPDPKTTVEPPAPGPGRFKINLSLSQIVGGSLAAATAAALGSKLGIAGTIGGAALASVVTAVAGSLYAASVERTRTGVHQVLKRRTPGTRPSSVRRLREQRASRAEPVISDGRPTRTRRLQLKGVVVGALAVFALASIGIFAFEELSGQALDGTKGGTTFSRVTHTGSKQHTTYKQSKTEKAEKSGSSGDSTSQPSTQPSNGPSEQPSESPSSQPSESPSSQPSESPSSQPSSSPSEPRPSESASSRPSTDSSQSDDRSNEAGTARS